MRLPLNHNLSCGECHGHGQGQGGQDDSCHRIHGHGQGLELLFQFKFQSGTNRLTDSLAKVGIPTLH